MTRKKQPALSGPQREVIDVLAHILAASEIARNVEGMEGFFESYLKDGLTPRQQDIWKVLQDRTRQVKKDICAMLKEEQSRA
jgi:hypothetical protein